MRSCVIKRGICCTIHENAPIGGRRAMPTHCKTRRRSLSSRLHGSSCRSDQFCAAAFASTPRLRHARCLLGLRRLFWDAGRHAAQKHLECGPGCAKTRAPHGLAGAVPRTISDYRRTLGRASSPASCRALHLSLKDSSLPPKLATRDTLESNSASILAYSISDCAPMRAKPSTRSAPRCLSISRMSWAGAPSGRLLSTLSGRPYERSREMLSQCLLHDNEALIVPLHKAELVHLDAG